MPSARTSRRLVGLIVAGVAGFGLLPSAAGGASAATPSPISGVGVPVPTPNGAAGTDQQVTLVVNGTPRHYRLFVPTSLPSHDARLVVVMHPLNGTSAGFESNSNFDLGAGNVGALVAYPQGLENSWDAGSCCGTAQQLHSDDVAFVDAVLDDVEASYPVDPARIAIGGFSNGAMMSYSYVCQRSSRVHTVFAGSGALMTPSCTFDRPVQVLHMHGMQDAIVPWQGTTSSKYPSDGVMPPVNTTVGRLDAADHCSPSWVGSKVNSLVNKYVPQTCPSGASLTLYQSQPLIHGWVTGPSAVSTYGLNETNLTWTWLLSLWNQPS